MRIVRNGNCDKWEMWEMGNGKKRKLGKMIIVRNGRWEEMRIGKSEMWELKNVITDK